MAPRARSLGFGLFGLSLLLTVPTAAHAQLGGCPSYIEITVYPASPFNQNAANITVEYGDDETEMCLSWGNSFDLETFVFKVDGSDVTSYFDVGAWQATGTNVPLNDDQVNALYAEIEGWDEDDNPVTNTDTRNVTVDWTPAPTISAGPYEYQVQDLQRCAASCFQVMQAYTTVPYFTMDQPQAVTLVYHGDRANPRPILQFDVTRPTGQSGVPTKYRFQAQIKSGGDWVTQTFTNSEQTIYYDTTASTTVRLKGQLADTSRATNVYDLKIIVGLYYGAPDNQWDDATYTTKLVWVNEKDAPVARGWTLGGEQRLHEQGDGSALITDGWGNAVYYPKTGGSFTTPNGDFAKLTFNSSDSTYTRAYPDSTKYRFNAAGLLTDIKDRFSNTWTFIRDGSNRVTEIRDPLYSGTNLRRIQLYYGSNGLDSIVDLGGRKTTVTVDATGLLTRIKDPTSDSTKYTYAAGSLGYRMTAVRDRRGNTTDFYYGAGWKLDSIMAPQVPIHGEGNERPTKRLTPWQPVGMATGSTSSTPWTPAKGDTIHGLTKDAENRTTMFTVDKWGQPVETVGAIGDTTRVLHDAASGLIIRVIHPWGGTDSTMYNASGLPTMLQRTDRGTVHYRYAGFGRIDSVWGDAPPRRDSIGTNGRVEWSRLGGSGSATKTTFTYNSRGQVTAMTDPDTNTRTWRYDSSSGNVEFDSLPGNRTRTVTHDTFGRVTIDSVRTQPPRTFYYNALNQVDSVSDGVNTAKTKFRYDGTLPLRIEDAKSQIYRFSYNALGWLTARYDPADTLNRKDTYEYERTGLLREWANRRGQAITFTYDAAGRLVKKSGTNSHTDSLWYAADFRSLVAIGEITRDSIRYTQGLLPQASVTEFCEPTCGNAFTFAYHYNARAELDSVVPTGPAGVSLTKRQYTWSTATGGLTQLKFGTATTSFDYEPRLLATTTVFPGGDTVSRSFTSVGERSKIIAPSSYAATVSREIELDSLRRVRGQVDANDDGVWYYYDGLGRVDSVRFGSKNSSCTSDDDYGEICPQDVWDHTDVFTYDAVGNRTDHSGTYTAGNRISSFDGWSFTHDLDGNVTQKYKGADTLDLRWTADGSLDSLRIDGTWHRLYYDVFGRLVAWDEDGSARRRFVWDGGNLLSETNGAITLKEGEYSYYPDALDELHAYIDGTGTAQHYAHVDALGNVIATTSTAPAVQQTITYDTWGKEESVSEPGGYSQRARWRGALSFQAELGLLYMRARWYDPSLGRFYSEDPAGVAASVNLYAFASNDPVNLRDATGAVPDTPGGGAPGNEDDDGTPTEVDAGTFCPFGGIYNPQHGTCQTASGSLYDSDLARAYVAYYDRGYDVHFRETVRSGNPSLVLLAYLAANGFSTDITVTHHFRTPQDHARLLRQGYKPDVNSLHLRGNAIDMEAHSYGPATFARALDAWVPGVLGGSARTEIIYYPNTGHVHFGLGRQGRQMYDKATDSYVAWPK